MACLRISAHIFPITWHILKELNKTFQTQSLSQININSKHGDVICILSLVHTDLQIAERHT